jgi:hypothetical protein
MNSGCQEGLRLRRRFETELREWGWFDAYEKAVEIMPVGLPKVHEFQRQVRNAESALFKARYAYTDHMAHCLACSSRLVVPDAIAIIQEKLREASEESKGI